MFLVKLYWREHVSGRRIIGGFGGLFQVFFFSSWSLDCCPSVIKQDLSWWSTFPENQRPYWDCNVTVGLLLFWLSFREDNHLCLVSGYEIAFICQSWHHWTCPSIFLFCTFLRIVSGLAISQWLAQGTPHYSTSKLGMSGFGYGEVVLFLPWVFFCVLLGFLYPANIFF